MLRYFALVGLLRFKYRLTKDLECITFLNRYVTFVRKNS